MLLVRQHLAHDAHMETAPAVALQLLFQLSAIGGKVFRVHGVGTARYVQRIAAQKILLPRLDIAEAGNDRRTLHQLARALAVARLGYRAHDARAVNLIDQIVAHHAA
jgi:hypothetical protein